MEEKLLSTLLHNCTVRLSTAGKKGYGTGFFVAQSMILTCAHVVQYAQQGNALVEVYWNNQAYTAQITRYLPDLDLALLQVPLPLPPPLTNHPCVFLNKEVGPFHQLYSYGYPDLNPFGEPSTFDSVGWTGDQPPQLKFKEGQVRPGQSGSPLLNWQIGAVCGLVQVTLDRNNSLGGKAILTETVLHAFTELIDLQRQFHQQDRRWANCLTVQQRQKLGLVNATEPIEVFFSYHPKDSMQRDELAIHLKPMKRAGLITDWYAANTEAGVEEKTEAKHHLDTARIILMLVSPDFLASDYHYDVEMARALERHKAGEARVIPIILKDTEGWNTTEFRDLLSLPRDRKPVNKHNKDEAFANIAREIRIVAESLKK
jgi:Trypsin-like peptidase domain/TIR domain